MTSLSKCIGVIGVGSLGEALINMFLNQSHRSSPTMIYGGTKRDDRVKELIGKSFFDAVENGEVFFTTDNLVVATTSDILILTVKPGQIKDVCNQIADIIHKDTVVISTAAAIPLRKLREWLPHTHTIIRCMPNVPCSIGEGIVPYISDIYRDHITTSNIMEDVFYPNKILELSNDAELNAATLISGCGPAFFAWYSDCLSKIGGNVLSSKHVKLMITQTMKGTAVMLETKTTDDIIKAVASPKGATETCLKSLQQANVDNLIINGLMAAQIRIDTMANMS